uniref:Uncharacterized protein n=1 Tax=Anguilla anguilla TaxID=7936 RepID=A0A0E9RVZ2_ANGAN
MAMHNYRKESKLKINK